MHVYAARSYTTMLVYGLSLCNCPSVYLLSKLPVSISVTALRVFHPTTVIDVIKRSFTRVLLNVNISEMQFVPPPVCKVKIHEVRGHNSIRNV